MFGELSIYVLGTPVIDMHAIGETRAACAEIVDRSRTALSSVYLWIFEHHFTD